MNILFFLTPKIEVAYVYEFDTIQTVMDKMERYKYSCVPVINCAGEYKGSLSEGDLLWALKDNKKQWDLKDTPMTDISRRVDYEPVSASAAMEHLIDKAMNQNFVPVVDDDNKFIGIITRKDIIHYIYKKIEVSTAESRTA